ncbi:hypothetical protein [uncultured Roseibium sp.]|uniref:hypothetical protein n=1 Tax=uncultured Roseibium sp. TaxID=1936171 RepID=UPI00260BFFE2|nr:hypothetical protein [uncultured Roseibium sp.]
MKTCTGTDRANSAADPDWWAQLEIQLQAVSDTVSEINDPDLEEAFEEFDKLAGGRFRASRKIEN